MVSEIHGKGSPDSGKPYHSQYLNETSFPVWKKFWEKLFRGLDLSKDEVNKMSDGFVKIINDRCMHVLNHALKVQKANDRAIETGESPEPV